MKAIQPKQMELRAQEHVMGTINSLFEQGVYNVWVKVKGFGGGMTTSTTAIGGIVETHPRIASYVRECFAAHGWHCADVANGDGFTINYPKEKP